MLAPHPAGSAVHRGYSWPGLEKVSNLMGDEENAEEVKRAEREVGDVKVCAFFFVVLINNILPIFLISVCLFFFTIYYLSPSSILTSLPFYIFSPSFFSPHFS